MISSKNSHDGRRCIGSIRGWKSRGSGFNSRALVTCGFLLAACGGHVETLEVFRGDAPGDTRAPDYAVDSNGRDSPAPDASNEARITPLATCLEGQPCSRLGDVCTDPLGDSGVLVCGGDDLPMTWHKP